MANEVVDVKKLNRIIDKYNKKNKPVKVDYAGLRDRLCRLVDKHGFEAVSLASGLAESSVRQHYRNATGALMISKVRLERAESILREYAKC